MTVKTPETRYEKFTIRLPPHLIKFVWDQVEKKRLDGIDWNRNREIQSCVQQKQIHMMSEGQRLRLMLKLGLRKREKVWGKDWGQDGKAEGGTEGGQESGVVNQTEKEKGNE